MMKKLTPMQQAFVEAYAGNAAEAAIKAGYSAKAAREIGYQNLSNPTIKEAIAKREAVESRVRIANRQERQQFWTETMQNLDAEMRDRLRASELLGRSEGDFLDRVEHSGSIDLAGAIEEARKRAAGAA